MKFSRYACALLSVVGLVGISGQVRAAQWDVTITNLTHGNHFTPLLVTAHDSNSGLFEVGATASSAMQGMAECGDLSGLLSTGEAGPADSDTIENPAGGLLAPGARTTAMITTADANTRYLTILGMVLPTNDGFVGLNAQAIPSAAGTYTYYLNAYDAGTEANNEVLDTSGCAVGMAGIPAAPGGDGGANATGVTASEANTMIHVHRGVLGDTNATGGASDLDSTVHRWQNPVAKVVVKVTP